MFVHFLASGDRARAQAQLLRFQDSFNRHRAALLDLGDVQFRSGLPPALAVDGLFGPQSWAALQRVLFVGTALDVGVTAAQPWASRMPGVRASGGQYATWFASRPTAPRAPGGPSGAAQMNTGPESAGSESVTELPVETVLGKRSTPGAQWPFYIGLAAVLGFGGWLVYSRLRA